MAVCIPENLARDAACFCFDNKTADEVIIYLLCAWANGGGGGGGENLKVEGEDLQIEGQTVQVS